MGCAFRLRRVGETVSRFRAIFRVALSATHPIWKPRPIIRPKTGSHFPEHPRCKRSNRPVKEKSADHLVTLSSLEQEGADPHALILDG